MSRRPVTATAWLEIDADEARYIRVIPRDPWVPMVTARWRPRWSWARTWRHRERVRFGAWEGSPRAVLVTGAHRAPGGWTMPDGRRLECVHPRGRCWPGPCVIHNPLSTHMDSWPLHWRDDRGIFERICRHGIGHPAPEQAAHIRPGGMVHGCCGCCAPPKPCACCQIPWAIPDEATRAAEATGQKPPSDALCGDLTGSGAQVGVSGPERGDACAHCGRPLGSFEAGIARIGDAAVCHPNDDGPDCYRLVTVYGEKLGARR